MKEILSEDKVWSALPQSDFKQKTSVVSVAIGVLLLVLGAGIIYASTLFLKANGSAQMLAMVAGTCVVIAGIIALWKRRYTIYEPTGCKVRQKNIYLSEPSAKKLVDALRRDAALDTLTFEPATANQYRFDIIGTTDGQYAIAQVLHYVPFNYEPLSPAYVLTEAEAEAIWAAVLRK